MTLKLTLLGGFQARLGTGGVLSLPSRKAQALLAYLGARPGQAHPRDKLAALLWEDSQGDQARDGLRHALAALRHALPATEPPIVVAKGHTLALSPAVVDVDVATFERRVAEGTPEALEQAAALYEGDLLSGFSLSEPLFEEWLVQERERLRELAIEALAKLLAHQAKSGATERAIQSAVRLLALDPLQEAVHRALMRLYVRQDRRGAALKQYQSCVTVLQRELGAAPEEETKQLYQEILRRRPVLEEASAPAALEGSPPFASIRRRPLSVAADAPLIGRDQEMTRLRVALAEAASGQGRVVAVAGEAGVGKTRLVAELAAETSTVRGGVLIGRCHESEQILPFGPWVEALATGPGLVNVTWLETLAPAVRRELGRLLPQLGPGADESPSPPDYLKLFEGVGLLLAHLADRQPTVLILEDLHWADEMTVRLLAFIGRRLPAWRLLVMATVRAEDLVDAPMLQRTLGELEREPHVATVALGPLSRSDTCDLVQALARPGRDDAAVARLSEQVWRTSGGNPFVVIEAMRAAADEALSPGLETLSLPERVRQIIGRQLDRLDERSRELVAQASVVGREFEFALLQHVSGLGEEEAARGVEELTRRRVLHSVGEGLDFAHDRVREVAYGRILAPRRKVLHRRVAEALATLHAESLESHHLALGLHYFEGEVWDKAVVHLRRAGARAVERSANREAAACFERALAALAHLPESPPTLEEAFEIHLDLRPVLILLGDVHRALERLREAEALAERTNDDLRRGRVCAFMAYVHSQRGASDEALASATRALAIANALGDLRLRILATGFLEQAHYYRGDYERVLDLTADNLGALPAAWVSEYFGSTQPASVYDRHWLVLSLAELGRFAEAARYEAEIIRLAEPTHHAHTIGVAYFSAGVLHLLKGDWATARPLIDQWVSVARAGEVVSLLPWAIAASAWVLAQLGERSEALTRLRESEQLLERQPEWGVVGNRRWCYHCLARARLVLGRLDDARGAGDRLVEPRSHAGFAAHALHLLGDIAAHPDRFDAEAGEAHYRRALALAEPRGMRPLIAHCHLGLGTLYRQTGKPREAHEHLTTATAMYREMDMRFWQEKAMAMMGALATSSPS